MRIPSPKRAARFAPRPSRSLTPAADPAARKDLPEKDRSPEVKARASRKIAGGLGTSVDPFVGDPQLKLELYKGD